MSHRDTDLTESMHYLYRDSIIRAVMPALKAGALYFAVAFAAGWILGPIRQLLVIPASTEWQRQETDAAIAKMA